MKKKIVCLLILSTLILSACGSKPTSVKKELKDEVKLNTTETDALDANQGSEIDNNNQDKTSEDTKSYEKIESSDQIIEKGSVVVVGNTGYEIYNYREDTAENYAKTVSALGKELNGKADVYDMLVPLSSEITFPDNLKNKINSSDQKKAMEDIFGKMEDSVKKVDIYDSLMSHRKEYIYFRTDHHWTALGAYYAYQKFCEVKGIEAEAVDGYETKKFDNFMGSFYNDTKVESLKSKPDTIEAYVPKADAKLNVTAADGSNFDWSIINDVKDYKPEVKYSTFVAGDNPMSVITNNDLTDGSSCVVVKESFGNAFIPFLVDHYQTVYVVDYRYWEGNLKSFVEEKGVKDILLLNNLSMIRNKYLVGQFQKVVNP